MKDTKKDQTNQGYSKDQKNEKQEGIVDTLNNTAALEKYKTPENKTPQNQKNGDVEESLMIKNDKNKQSKEDYNNTDKSKKSDL